MRYSLLAGGKRIRPVLSLATADAIGRPTDWVLPLAAAIELIHTYSLIHDDLPAMDDDALRRGKPTCHVVFGEAQAILAGDALLTLAFEVLATWPEGDELARRRVSAVRTVAQAAGPLGMVGGQLSDLEAEARALPPAPAGSAIGERLVSIHRRKTGALMGASVALGGILGGLAPAAVESLERFGCALGLAFQVADDVLDVESSAD